MPARRTPLSAAAAAAKGPCRVANLLAAVEALAPAALAEPWDNVGLLLGDPRSSLQRAMTCLELTPAVLREAIARRVQAIVAHHPPIFSGLKTLREDQPQGALLAGLLRARIAVIAAHTNLDAAPWGTSDVLAAACGLTPLAPRQTLSSVKLPDGRAAGLGLLAEPPAAVRTLGGLVRLIRRRMRLPPLRVTQGRCRTLRRVALCSGAGGSFVAQAARAGADVLITGEMNHHQAADAAALGLSVIQLGHFESEVIIAEPLATRLSADLAAAGHHATLFAARRDVAPFVYLE